MKVYSHAWQHLPKGEPSLQTLFAGWFALSAFRFITIESVGRGLVSRRYANLLIFFRMMKIQKYKPYRHMENAVLRRYVAAGSEIPAEILAPALRFLNLSWSKFEKRALPEQIGSFHPDNQMTITRFLKTQPSLLPATAQKPRIYPDLLQFGNTFFRACDII